MKPSVDLLGRLDGPALRVRLLPVVPDSVPVRPAPGALMRLWPPWVAAMTLPWGIYVRPAVLSADPDRLSRLIAHELVHARQWRTMGPIAFLSRYVTDYLRGRLEGMSHRAAYEAITLESEARAIAGRILQSDDREPIGDE